MEPELKQKLENIQKLAEENNKMLHKVRGVQKREAIWKVLKVLIIIAIGVGSFYFIQPYIDQVQKLTKDSGAMISNLKNILPNLPR